MKTVCIGMDEQGQFFVGMKPEGMDGAPPAPQGSPMSNSMDPNSDSDYRDEMPEGGPDRYMQPVQSMAEAFQTARSMLTAGDDASREAEFDAGVKRVLGPNPKPGMGAGPGKPPMPPMRGGMKSGM